MLHFRCNKFIGVKIFGVRCTGIMDVKNCVKGVKLSPNGVKYLGVKNLGVSNVLHIQLSNLLVSNARVSKILWWQISFSRYN